MEPLLVQQVRVHLFRHTLVKLLQDLIHHTTVE